MFSSAISTTSSNMTKPTMFRVRLGAVLALLAAVALQISPSTYAAAGDRATKVPHNAASKAAREDLSAPLRERGEIRVVVGLQTPVEIAESVDRTPDHTKEQKVAARQ